MECNITIKQITETSIFSLPSYLEQPREYENVQLIIVCRTNLHKSDLQTNGAASREKHKQRRFTLLFNDTMQCLAGDGGKEGKSINAVLCG
jgi:hypothetical protein